MKSIFYCSFVKHLSLKMSFSINLLKCNFSSIIEKPTINTPNRIESNYFSGKMFGDKKWYNPQIKIYQKQVLQSISKKK